MTTITLYRGARDPTPAQILDLPWHTDDADAPKHVGATPNKETDSWRYL